MLDVFLFNLYRSRSDLKCGVPSLSRSTRDNVKYAIDLTDLVSFKSKGSRSHMVRCWWMLYNTSEKEPTDNSHQRLSVIHGGLVFIYIYNHGDQYTLL